jgi:hypothetical protein
MGGDNYHSNEHTALHTNREIGYASTDGEHCHIEIGQKENGVWTKLEADRTDKTPEGDDYEAVLASLKEVAAAQIRLCVLTKRGNE